MPSGVSGQVFVQVGSILFYLRVRLGLFKDLQIRLFE
jgi:hypothetical protein